MKTIFVMEYYRDAQRKVQEEIYLKPDSYIIGVNETEYLDFLMGKYALPLIERDISRDITIDPKTEWVSRQDGFSKYEQAYAEIGYPIAQRAKVETAIQFRGSSWSSLPTGQWQFEPRTCKVVIKIERNEQFIPQAISTLESNWAELNLAITQQNSQLKSYVEQTIRQRKQEVTKRKTDFEELIKRIDIPLVQKPLDAMPIVNLDVKEEIKILIPPEPQRHEEYYLDKPKALAIVEIIQKIGRGFEITPTVFAKLEEEDLRSVILGLLNAVFVVYVGGSATAETFSKRGKTDIHLQIPKGDILIAECKFWGGNERYAETMDQLFRYLTWRQNYGIIITFSRNTGFTNVTNSVAQAIAAHPTYKSKLEQINPTHFESLHRFPDDPQKSVEIHHLIFNLFSLDLRGRKTESKRDRRTRQKITDAKDKI